MANDARIVIVDDHEANVTLLRHVLEQAGYTGMVGTTDSSRAIALCAERPTDLLLLDLHMPSPDGFDVMSDLQAAGETFPIIALTADATPEIKLRALGAGARDFLTKPFDRAEVLLRIENHLEMQLLQRQLRRHNERLEEEVAQRTRELEEARIETLDRLALVSEYRDDDTGEHVQRVGRSCALMAKALGIASEEVRLIRHASTLHDIGKVGIPDHILLKQGRLDDEELEQMRLHVALSERILSGSRSQLLQLAQQIARSHHERWDGTGYPRGIAGEEIPLVGRIAAIADVFDALTHARPYKEAWPVEKALEEIRAGSGRQFDPHLVEVFLGLDHGMLLGPAASPLSPDGDLSERAAGR